MPLPSDLMRRAERHVTARRAAAARIGAVAALVGGAVAMIVGGAALVDSLMPPSVPAPAAAAGPLEPEGAPGYEVASVPHGLARPVAALLLGGGVLGLFAAWRGERGPGVQRAFACLAVGLFALAAGSAAAEWLGRDAMTPTFFGLSFLAEMLGLLAAVAGAAALGVLAWRTGDLPRGAALALAAAPCGFLLTVLFPSASWVGLVWLGAVWLAVGVFLRHAPRADRRPLPAAPVRG